MIGHDTMSSFDKRLFFMEYLLGLPLHLPTNSCKQISDFAQIFFKIIITLCFTNMVCFMINIMNNLYCKSLCKSD